MEVVDRRSSALERSKMHPDMPLKHVPVPGSTSPQLGFSLLLQRGQKFEPS
jgi:hypothetical protein